MPNRRRPMALLWAGLLASAATVATASEVSERLVARGQLAYDAARYDEARARFAEAADADPHDAVARYDLGLALLALERWDEAARAFERALALQPDLDDARRALEVARARGGAGAPEKPWEIHAATGVQYDSNVKVAPSGDVIPGIGDRDDVAFVLAGGGRYDLLSRPDALLRVEYDLYQTLHPDLDDFDFRSHRVRATGSWAVRPDVWLGLQGGYNHYTLGPHSYLGEPFFLPFVSLLERGWGLTQVSYRQGEDTYLSTPFHEVRDGPNYATAVDQTFFLDHGVALSLGWAFTEERPRSSAGADWAFRANQGRAGVSVPLAWSIDADLTYLYRHDAYTKPNSFAAFRVKRSDDEHHVALGLRRPIAPHLSALVTYYATINDSNIDLFTYDRHVVSALLEVSY